MYKYVLNTNTTNNKNKHTNKTKHKQKHIIWEHANNITTTKHNKKQQSADKGNKQTKTHKILTKNMNKTDIQ